jgi:translation initiation factor IF-2
METHFRSFTSWVEDVPIALNGLLVLVRRERLLGYADVRKCSRFRESARSPDAWHPKVSSGAVRQLRDAAIVRDGQVKLRRFKNDVSEVKAGYECGNQQRHPRG